MMHRWEEKGQAREKGEGGEGNWLKKKILERLALINEAKPLTTDAANIRLTALRAKMGDEARSGFPTPETISFFVFVARGFIFQRCRSQLVNRPNLQIQPARITGHGSGSRHSGTGKGTSRAIEPRKSSEAGHPGTFFGNHRSGREWSN